MAQIPTPPASRQSSEAPLDAQQKPLLANPSAKSLLPLDSLLEQYLYLLDRHQELLTGLGKRFSSGFFSLAHANYTCPPGRRYGADYYDERMKANRKISVQPLRSEGHHLTEAEGGSEGSFSFRIECTSCRPSEERAAGESMESRSSQKDSKRDQETASEEETTTTKDAPSQADKHSEIGSAARPTSESSKRRFRSSDPISWYGILVPQSLRGAQTSFTEAVEGILPELAGVIVEMRNVENKIDRLRGELRESEIRNS